MQARSFRERIREFFRERHCVSLGDCFFGVPRETTKSIADIKLAARELSERVESRWLPGMGAVGFPVLRAQF